MSYIITKEMQDSRDRTSLYYLYAKMINGAATLEQVSHYNQLAEKFKYDNCCCKDKQEEQNTPTS